MTSHEADGSREASPLISMYDADEDFKTDSSGKRFAYMAAVLLQPVDVEWVRERTHAIFSTLKEGDAVLNSYSKTKVWYPAGSAPTVVSQMSEGAQGADGGPGGAIVAVGIRMGRSRNAPSRVEARKEAPWEFHGAPGGAI